MRTRRGLGKGMGSGYHNLVPTDPHIHSLSAKGVKTKLYLPYNRTFETDREMDDFVFEQMDAKSKKISKAKKERWLGSLRYQYGNRARELSRKMFKKNMEDLTTEDEYNKLFDELHKTSTQWAKGKQVKVGKDIWSVTENTLFGYFKTASGELVKATTTKALNKNILRDAIGQPIIFNKSGQEVSRLVVDYIDDQAYFLSDRSGELLAFKMNAKSKKKEWVVMEYDKTGNVISKPMTKSQAEKLAEQSKNMLKGTTIKTKVFRENVGRNIDGSKNYFYTLDAKGKLTLLQRLGLQEKPKRGRPEKVVEYDIVWDKIPTRLTPDQKRKQAIKLTKREKKIAVGNLAGADIGFVAGGLLGGLGGMVVGVPLGVVTGNVIAKKIAGKPRGRPLKYKKKQGIIGKLLETREDRVLYDQMMLKKERQGVVK